MLKKVILGLMVLGTSMVFGMSLSQLNSASKEGLMEINGIGDAKAKAILKERKKGKFTSFKDFERVEGIGVQTAANVKNGVKSSKEVKKVKKYTNKSIDKKEKKKRKIKSMDEKKKELKTKKTKVKKDKQKKAKTKKEKKIKVKKKD
jgi:competence protein ComEA